MTEALSAVLNEFSQILLVPCLFLLCLLALMAILSCGGAIGEFFLDRRWLKKDGTALLIRLHAAGPDGLVECISRSSLLSRHKKCLNRLLQARDLPDGELEILSEKLIADEESARKRALDRVNLIVKLGPMVGLLGTLIPLGPGIVALGQGDTATLSNSLQVAFNTTIVGVAASGLSYLVSMVRRHWYYRDSVLLESLVGCCMEELQHAKR